MFKCDMCVLNNMWIKPKKKICSFCFLLEVIYITHVFQSFSNYFCVKNMFSGCFRDLNKALWRVLNFPNIPNFRVSTKYSYFCKVLIEYPVLTRKLGIFGKLRTCHTAMFNCGAQCLVFCKVVSGTNTK